MLSCLSSGPPVVRNKFPFPSRSQIYKTLSVLIVASYIDTYHHSNTPNIHLFTPRDVENYLWRPILKRLDIGHVVIFPKPCLTKVTKHRPAITIDEGNEWPRCIDYTISLDFARAGRS